MSDRVVPLDVVRQLALVGTRISTGHELRETLQAIADGVVEVMGFGAAVVNHKTSTGDFTVVAVAGPADLERSLLGEITPRAVMESALERCQEWGGLRFGSYEDFRADEPAQWVPDMPVVEAPDAWHPLDMLLAPMCSEDGEMLGVLSVDLPPEGRRPSRELCELLEIFATQASIAIAAVELRERYVRVRESRERLLRDLAERDALTGVANRRVLASTVRVAVRESARTGRRGAVFSCDLDGLKQVNDQYGHHAGDIALQSWAEALVDACGDDAVVCRVGGDEFVVVAPRLDGPDVQRLATRLRSLTIGAPDAPRPMSLSVGVAVIDGTVGAETLLRRADRAMYADKNGGAPSLRAVPMRPESSGTA